MKPIPATDGLTLDDQQQAARAWFEALRDRICAAFEEIEREAGSDAVFDIKGWDRLDADGGPGGGGPRGRRSRAAAWPRLCRVRLRATRGTCPPSAC